MLTTDHLSTDTIQEIVLGPEDPRWDETRQAFNLLLDQRPAAIALPRDEREVAAVVLHARERGLRVDECQRRRAAQYRQRGLPWCGVHVSLLSGIHHAGSFERRRVRHIEAHPKRPPAAFASCGLWGWHRPLEVACRRGG
jgi:hypothetical protein